MSHGHLTDTFTASLLVIVLFMGTISGQDVGLGSLLPPTCRQMLTLMTLRSSNMNNNTTVDEFKSLDQFCPMSKYLLTCVSENIFEMKRTPDPLVWASAFLYEFQTARNLSQIVCLWKDFPTAGTEDCLTKTRDGRDRCRDRIRSNLQYVRDNLNPDMPESDVADLVCPIYYELGQCVEMAINKDCSPETVVHMKLFYMIMGRFNCSRNNKNNTGVSIVSSDSNIGAKAIENTLTACGFDTNLYGLPISTFSFRNYISSVSKICFNLNKIVLCLKDILKNPETGIHRFLTRSIDIDGMERYNQALCTVEQNLRDNVMCLNKLNSYIEYCASFVKRNNVMDRLYDNAKKAEPITCSLTEDFANCFAIQVSRCDFRISQTLMTAHLEGLHRECKVKKHTPSHIGGSVIVHCGVAIATEIQTRMAKLGNITFVDIITHLVEFMCTEIKMYTACLHRYFYSSTSLFDRFFNRILDLSDTRKTERSLENVCENVENIKRQLPCLADKKRFQECTKLFIPLIQLDIFDARTTTEEGAPTRFCHDLVALTNCTLNVISQCDSGLGQIAETAAYDLLRAKDCVNHVPTGCGPVAEVHNGLLLMLIFGVVCIFFY